MNAPRGIYSRGYLPHHDHPRFTQFVTFRLADSMPNHLVDEWRHELARLTEAERMLEEYRRADAWLDRGSGSCSLSEPRIATLVSEALCFSDGRLYHLRAWVVMPNHVHALITVGEEASLGDIIASWKKYTGRRANAILGREGAFWYREYYDRWMRNEEHLERTLKYIHMNPVKAGLCQTPGAWPWSSATGTADLQIGENAVVRESRAVYGSSADFAWPFDSADLEIGGPSL
jgi:REP element-mobilizing transposase RayT